jgi:hypothetical protein
VLVEQAAAKLHQASYTTLSISASMELLQDTAINVQTRSLSLADEWNYLVRQNADIVQMLQGGSGP